MVIRENRTPTHTHTNAHVNIFIVTIAIIIIVRTTYILRSTQSVRFDNTKKHTKYTYVWVLATELEYR